MKKSNQKSMFGLSLVTAMLLVSSAYAGQIIGTNANDAYVVTTPPTQTGFGGWNLDNVDVYITNLEYVAGTKIFDKLEGTYDVMTHGDSFESQIMTEGEHRGNLHGKNWPVGEPSGIKIVNGDKENNGKPGNCIMTTSYLSLEDNPAGVNGYLDSATPAPTICSSAFQTHKRFKVNMLESTVEGKDPGEYGNPIDLVFNLVEGDTTTLRYQVLQKINNYTGMRLDGYTVEVLDATGTINPALTLSIGLGENAGTDIWDTEDMANYSHGLWGPMDNHFPTDGFFDSKRAGFVVDSNGHGTSTLVGGPTTLGGNYTKLFGSWLPSKWQPTGIFWDNDNDPLTDAELVAFWGTAPDAAPGTAPSWHKGMADNWEEPTESEFLAWMTSPLYAIGQIEDTLNLGLNYIVNVGSNAAIGDRFTIRITPHIALDQTPPSYADENGSIDPEPPVITDGTVAISPAPTFIIGDILNLSVKDEDQNKNATVKDTTTVTVTTDTGDKETVTLTETEVDNAIFTATIASVLTTSSPVVEDGKISVVKDSVVTVTYVDDTHSDTASTVATIEVETDDAVDSEGNTASSGGGGCTYNQNSKSFDMMFLFIAALGLLFPFRKRFLK